ncbi:hypothetical protein A3B45_04000 [Candidatus Daviesbacteria bacterium RIFCSPLOWO2_01_FULL_39_12]|uniref:Uncharacterized protein n=1 Tax=Candidatus Daviesbacteria bacterium RIFCSPLOWO2_01_FULL_39_12 TaxID=1797785 RepID=A0A1F5KS54_9BACT|nr:MAG: hypothetical protein A3D79_01855 [Candidatus Daviesbacteria bacterium RIFCSPHIGHO2_02_FULL_39_8]OGE43742.1 MAG: hypothetical protein A3B45_04000 [Candidatus Daviesbacteria bacterium RIFCSPLOWO2_01_FULL_39_12]
MNFDFPLKKILEVLGEPDRDIRNILNQFNSLTASRFQRSILEKIDSEKSETRNIIRQILKNDTLEEKTVQMIAKFTKEWIGNKNVMVMYLDCRLSSFLDITGLILEDATDKEKAEIRSILKTDKYLSQILF